MMFMMGERVDPAAAGLELQRPGEWDSDIKEFLKKTATFSGPELRKVGQAVARLCHVLTI